MMRGLWICHWNCHTMRDYRDNDSGTKRPLGEENALRFLKIHSVWLPFSGPNISSYFFSWRVLRHQTTSVCSRIWRWVQRCHRHCCRSDIQRDIELFRRILRLRCVALNGGCYTMHECLSYVILSYKSIPGLKNWLRLIVFKIFNFR